MVSIFILQIIARTPIWVWPLLGFLLFKGIRAFWPSVMNVYKIFIFPAIFLVLSLNGLIATSGCMSCIVFMRFSALLIGSIVGLLLFKGIVVEADKKKSLIRVPGTASTLLLILAIFSIKYYFGFKSAIDPALAKTFVFVSAKLVITGITSGITIGRALCYWYKYKIAAHTDLI